MRIIWREKSYEDLLYILGFDLLSLTHSNKRTPIQTPRRDEETSQTNIPVHSVLPYFPYDDLYTHLDLRLRVEPSTDWNTRTRLMKERNLKPRLR